MANEPDIFVSFTPIDNKPLLGEEKGWVTKLINGLKILLGQKLGRGANSSYSLWTNNSLREDETVLPHLAEKLENTAIFLLILSPNYLQSKQREELSIFLERVGTNSGRLFIIVQHNFIRFHKDIHELQGHRIWIINDPEYYQQLNNIAQQLANKIKVLRKETPAIIRPLPEDSPQATIFLAQPTEDLLTYYEQLKAYLYQHKFQVLPNSPYAFSSKEKRHQTIYEDLKKSNLFLQLLSKETIQNSTEIVTPKDQYDLAQLAKIPLLQWRDNQLDLNTVQDPLVRAFLESNSVISTTFNDFKQRIIQKLETVVDKKPKIPQRPFSKKILNALQGQFIFINATIDDNALAKQLGQLLCETYEMVCALPLDKGEPDELREYLEDNLLECNATLIIYGNSPKTWIVRQLRQVFKVVSQRREKPFVAVCEIFSEQESLNIIIPPYVSILNCCDQPPEVMLHTFISSLENYL
ncbi:hypothetical protein [Candidatus Parabeggiatoa sp. HSG14]|uniref:hypothetical protein n=1 Tax=Candidatus Parabeggiatoa sp. HSG14 TaxID=3055593 RepID=UPI0025A6D373|nr:hypothetical protein [Thiotrichales bacterium HSG14]